MIMLVLVWLWLGAAAPVFAQKASTAGAASDWMVSREQAIQEVFPGATSVEERRWQTGEDADQATDSAGRSEPERRSITLVFDGSRRFLGYAVVTEERGKYRPITFLVGVGRDLRVKGVVVLAYRESRGGEVRQKRFLDQYIGKGAGDPVRAGRDIINVSGATLSVRSINAGVRRVLRLVDAAFRGKIPIAGPRLEPLRGLR